MKLSMFGLKDIQIKTQSEKRIVNSRNPTSIQNGTNSTLSFIFINNENKPL
jgi:hypothetical protein